MKPHEGADEDETVRERGGFALSEHTPIRVGLIIALLGFMMTALGGSAAAIWWAATISAKLDALLTQQSALASMGKEHSRDIEDLKAWRIMIEKTGTPAMVERVGVLEKEFSDIRREFDLHKAQRTSP